MHTRLVVGSGRLGETLLAAVDARPGRTVVVREDDTDPEVEASSSDVIGGDPTDAATFAAVDGVETVIVADEDPGRNLAVARTAREAFPDAFVLAYAGQETADGTRRSLREVADRLVDPRTVLGAYLADHVVTGGTSMHELRSVLTDVEGPLAVATHDNPDPDAIASAVAFQRVAERMGRPAQACYYGSINHQENRAMVNLLEYDLRALDDAEDLAEFGGVALVDHARPGINDGLPAETDVDVVVDHHPPRGPVAARFADLRSDVGATSTILVEYYRRLGVEPAADVATGLLFGIRVDTDAFRREVSVTDFEAGAFLFPHADLGALERIENPNVSADTLETVAEAIASRDRYGAVLVSGVGRIRDRDTLAQAADRLLNMEGITTTLVHGIADGTICVSARARGTDLDLGEALRAAFEPIGDAGGHADMAGAQIELGLLEEIDEDDRSLREVVDELVAERFLDALEMHPSQLSLGTYGMGTEGSRSAVDGLPTESGDRAGLEGRPVDPPAEDATEGSNRRIGRDDEA